MEKKVIVKNTKKIKIIKYEDIEELYIEYECDIKDLQKLPPNLKTLSIRHLNINSINELTLLNLPYSLKELRIMFIFLCRENGVQTQQSTLDNSKYIKMPYDCVCNEYRNYETKFKNKDNKTEFIQLVKENEEFKYYQFQPFASSRFINREKYPQFGRKLKILQEIEQ